MPCSMQAAEALGDLNRKDRSVKPRSGLWSGILVLQLLRFVASDLRMEGLRQRREALQAPRRSAKILEEFPWKTGPKKQTCPDGACVSN